MSVTLTNGESQWKGLLIAGGVAPLFTVLSYLTEAVAIPWDSYPETGEQWLSLFSRSRLLGLLYLNALDIVSICFLVLLFLAIYVAVRDRSPSLGLIGAAIGCVGITAFVATRGSLVTAALVLGARYDAASLVERDVLGQAYMAIGATGVATTQTIGFLIQAVGVILISIAMIRKRELWRVAGIFGVAAGALTVADFIRVLIDPSLGQALMIATAPLWVVWWILAGIQLLRLGTRLPRGA